MRDSEISPVQGYGIDADEDFVSFGSGDRGGMFGDPGGACDGGKTVGNVLLSHGAFGVDCLGASGNVSECEGRDSWPLYMFWWMVWRTS